MTFNSIEIQQEYDRLLGKVQDFTEIQHPLINLSDTLRAYFALADYFTDDSSGYTETMLVNVRSIDLLCSAIGRQIVSFDGHIKYTNPIDICSTLFYGMVKNHSFSDGNKRTALLVLLYQLDMYSYLPNCSVNEFERLVVAVAANQLEKQYSTIWKKFKKRDDPEIATIAYLLRRMTTKKDHKYHLKITMKDMVSALSNYNVNYEVENGKIRFERKHKNWIGFEKTFKYTVVFGGWTRCIGPQTARDILTNLELYNQIPDYRAFIDGQELYYSLIQDFEIPLRRLKDE